MDKLVVPNYQVRNGHVDFETREEGDQHIIAGYFAVFGSDYQIFEGATESIDPHAFDGQLAGDVRCLINHDTRLVLGRTLAGTLMLRVDDKGLYGEVQVNGKDQEAMNEFERVKRRDVSQCSFGFDITDEETTQLPDGSVHWLIKSVKLYEVSVCTFPAYEQTAVEARKNDLKNIQKRSLDVWKASMLKKLKGEVNA